MVNHVDPSVPDREVMVMFNEAHGDKGKVTKERFCDTLLRHGLFEYQPRVSSSHRCCCCCSWFKVLTHARTPQAEEAEAGAPLGLATVVGKATSGDRNLDSWPDKSPLQKEMCATDVVLQNFHRPEDSVMDYTECHREMWEHSCSSLCMFLHPRPFRMLRLMC